MGGASRLLALALLAGLAGCRGTPRALDNDPLLGGSPLPRAPAGSLPPPPRPQDAVTRGEVPPVPPPNSSTSPAALTSGVVAPAADASAPPVTLGGPRAPAGRAVRSESPERGVAQPVSAGVPLAGSFEMLQQQLLARGVVWQQLKMVGRDDWEYTCAIPSDPRQPSIQERYSVRAAGPLGLEAMRLVLEKIDQERR